MSGDPSVVEVAKISVDDVKDIWFHIRNTHESVCGVRVRELVNRIWSSFNGRLWVTRS
jgi:hypothetical protein